MKTPVPPKRDQEQWRRLRSWFFERHREVVDWRRRYFNERRHAIEREIVRLEALPEDPGRGRLIDSLKNELAEIGG